MEIKYFLYFLIGGMIVSLVTYFASQAKGLLAAFIATLPIITLITFFTIYFASSQEAVISYAKGLVIMLTPWLIYILNYFSYSQIWFSSFNCHWTFSLSFDRLFHFN